MNAISRQNLKNSGINRNRNKLRLLEFYTHILNFLDMKNQTRIIVTLKCWFREMILLKCREYLQQTVEKISSYNL